MSIKVLALDLERTLIDDAFSARRRPGLRRFLAFCDSRFERVAIFSTVEESEARQVIEDLRRRGDVPARLSTRLEYVNWSGERKDLEFIPGVSVKETALVDDDAGWIRPDQREQWIAIAPWDGDDEADEELLRIESVLESRITSKT